MPTFCNIQRLLWQHRAGAAVALACILSACGGGNGQGLDVNGRPWWESTGGPGSPDSGTGSDGAFNRIQQEILTPDCAMSGCHSSTTSPLGLSLDSGKAYRGLVHKASNQVSGLMLVEPNNADASYLMQKILGTQSGGLQMPLGKPSLSVEKIQAIRQWINDGAKAPVSSPDSGPDSNPDSGDNDTDNPEPAPELLATLSSIQTLVFEQRCTGCHSGDNPLGELDLSNGKSYTQLVERSASIDPQAGTLVSIGDAGDSFLMDKLRGQNLGTIDTPGYLGLRMPLMGGYLDDPTMQVIESWINNGAKDN
ncbi:MAG: hypothetical protein V3U76_18785 [Granulosicoccus sp.]